MLNQNECGRKEHAVPESAKGCLVVVKYYARGRPSSQRPVIVSLAWLGHTVAIKG